jgi:hypothetical protein
MIDPKFTITKKSTTDKVKGFPDYVQDIMWTASHTEGDYTVSQNGGFGLELTPSPTFIRFEDLTDEQCVDWLKQSLGDKGMTLVSGLLQEKLDAAKLADLPRIQMETLAARLAALEAK